MRRLETFLRDDDGSSAAEYALILGLVALAIVGGILTLQGALVSAIDTMDNTFTNLGF